MVVVFAMEAQAVVDIVEEVIRDTRYRGRGGGTVVVVAEGGTDL